MTIFSAILGFFSALPDLIKIYQSIVKLIGKAQLQSFLNDLDESVAIVEKSRQPGISLEEKHKLRKQALEKGSNLWGKALG